VSSVEDKKVIAKMGTQTRDEAVECMCWAVPGAAEGAEGAENGVEPCNRVFTGRADGVVQLWDVQKQLQVSAPGGAREALALAPGMPARAAEDRLLCARTSTPLTPRNAHFARTQVSIMEPLSVAHEEPRSIFMLNCAAGAAARLITCCENGAVNIRTLDEALENAVAQQDVTVVGPVSRMRGAHSGTKLGYGGKENELQVFDIASEKVEWKAKNVPNNFLDLRLPVWVTDLQFLRNSNDRKIAICTAYGQVRLYDVRAQRRPVLSAVVTDKSEQIRLDDGTRLTCLSLSHDQTWAAVGDAQGELRKVDLKTGNVFGKFKHISGSIRGAAFHPSPLCNYIAAAGLDRHVRVYDAKKMSCISTIYAKQKLNCLLFDPQPPTQSASEEADEEDWLGIQEAKALAKKKKEEEEEEDAGGDGDGDDTADNGETCDLNLKPKP
jgi:ribosome biogenesis protein NSA1